MNKISVVCCSMFVLILGCKSQTDVQGGYVSQRDDCRELAVLKQQLYTQELENLNQQDRNAQLLTLFGHCMYERGWTVAAPVKKARPPSEPLPGSQLQVPVTDPSQVQVEVSKEKPVSQITPLQGRPIDSQTQSQTGAVGGERQIPVENEIENAVDVPSSNVPIQTPF